MFVTLQDATDEALKGYDRFMIEAAIRAPTSSLLANNIWAEVLRELHLRKHVTLISGTFDDPGNAAIRRNWT